MYYKNFFLCFLILAMQTKNVIASKTSTSPYINGIKTALYFGSSIAIAIIAISPITVTLNNICNEKNCAEPLIFTIAFVVAFQACLKCGKENLFKIIKNSKTLKAKKLEAYKPVTKT